MMLVRLIKFLFEKVIGKVDPVTKKHLREDLAGVLKIAIEAAAEGASRRD